LGLSNQFTGRVKFQTSSWFCQGPNHPDTGIADFTGSRAHQWHPF